MDMEMEMEMEDAAVPALAVVDARFCAADVATLAVAKALSMSGSDFAVTDAATGALVLRVDGVLFSLRRRCVLVDADRRPVLTVQESVCFLTSPSRSRSICSPSPPHGVLLCSCPDAPGCLEFERRR